MERRELQFALAVLVAAAIGFAIAVLLFSGKGSSSTTTTSAATTSATSTAANGTTTVTTSTTSTTAPATTPTTPPSESDCIAQWNEPANRGAQTYLVNLASQQPVRVHVGTSSEVPPKCLVTVLANNGSAYVFAGGAGATYPYAPAPGQTQASSLPLAQRTSNALEQRDGTLTAR